VPLYFIQKNIIKNNKMKTFKIKVHRDITTYESLVLTEDQIRDFKIWLVDAMGCEEDELNEDNWDPNLFNDYLEEVDIEKTINKQRSSTEVDFTN